ncbi:MAG: carbamoyltransferase HypF [Rhodocyclaceae bacterium]|nr:carbamoyltransferase HypF [Rhodocyclaceae bacterium]MBX3668034.1 carbamoyltransferase HypF [Rhodocyclaceae bacterium]
MTQCVSEQLAEEQAYRISVRGIVQGVGFRPAVWRMATRLGLRGSVGNDGAGVNIVVCGTEAALEQFFTTLKQNPPRLARIDGISREAAPMVAPDSGFKILPSRGGEIRTGVAADAATCPECLREVLDPFSRRYRYPFTNCTQCGPRLSIVQAIPYDRATTTMRDFAMCRDCAAEYENSADRRFHAQPIACHACGPRVWLERSDGAKIAIDSLTTLDATDAVASLIKRGHIVAIKGLGGFQLACDATNEAAVSRLRRDKRRSRKPFALMARDVDVLARYAVASAAEIELLRSPQAPIVILPAGGARKLAASVAPGISTLGFMLPNTPLHHLMLRRLDTPIVLTSGNLSDEPQCIDNAQARECLHGIAEYFLMHDRPIARRVDDSVVRVVAGAPRILRRARGYAPTAITLPPGFKDAPAVLAMGAELKNTFCLLRDQQAVLSHHMGDLADARTLADYRASVAQYLELFDQHPKLVAIDVHPEYLSSKYGIELARDRGLPLEPIQHHHAHVAACLAEHGRPLDAAPVLGIVLDGLGLGGDGNLWGGEFLLADYRNFKRQGTFKPVPLLGGEQAMREPWRNTYAHILAEMGWNRFAMNFAELELFRFLSAKPRSLLDGMLARHVNSPLASSCGRLFDAVAAATGICRERLQYEAQAAIEFEALADPATLADDSPESAYPFAIPMHKALGIPYIEPLAMWQALLGDLLLGTKAGVISARFHKGLADVIARMAEKLAHGPSGQAEFDTIVLTGGVFQNRILFEHTSRLLAARGFHVLAPRAVPAHDGGLALGQATIAAARAAARAAKA